MNNILFKAWFGTILSLLGSLLPTWTTQDKPLAAKAPVAIVAVAQAHRDTLFHKKPAAPSVVYPTTLCTFTGTTRFDGIPNGNAQVFLWITTPSGHEVHELTLAADGSFGLSLNVRAKTNEPIDWEIRGVSVGCRMLQRAGRQIVMDDRIPIAVDNTLEFVAD
jgi:hypothetical protein